MRWCKTYEDAVGAAKKLGRPMVLVFGRESEHHQRAVNRMFQKGSLAPFLRRFVFAYFELEITRDDRIFHRLFHKYTPLAGEHRLPLIFIADANEKVLAKTEGFKRPRELAARMRKALEAHGPVATTKRAREILRKLDKANALLKKERHGAAARLYQEIVAAKLKMPATAEAKAKLAKIEKMASKQLKGARTDIADKAYPHAIEKLLDLERNFPSLQAGKQARGELAKLQKLPQAKAAFAALEKKAAAARKTKKRSAARGLTTDPSEIDKNFFTDEELGALDAMAQKGQEPQPARSATAKSSAECRRLLSLARSWIANKRPDKAKQLLRRVVEKYPTTIYADQAKALLKKLKH